LGKLIVLEDHTDRTAAYATYHFSSAQELTTEIVEIIESTFKSKPISITVEEEMDTTEYLRSRTANKVSIEMSLDEAKNNEFIILKPEEPGAVANQRHLSNGHAR
jgi:hypothetical protein